MSLVNILSPAYKIDLPLDVLVVYPDSVTSLDKFYDRLDCDPFPNGS